MTVKILGGQFKSFSLSVPDNSSTRPTSIILRRKLFDRFQNCQGYIFIDVCCGSGPMGLEALSRGAEQVYFIESRREAAVLLRKNIEAISIRHHELEIVGRCHIQQQDAVLVLEDCLKKFAGNQDVLLFFDPPYEDHGLYKKITDILVKHQFAGHILIEGDKKKGPALNFWQSLPWPLEKSYSHSDHFINWYWPKASPER